MGATLSPDALIISLLVAATLPFVASLLSSLLPATKVRDIGDYFVFDRQLDVDGFLKATIGYSLQVAAIALFFYWSFTYGLLPPLIVCIAWSGSYALMGVAVKSGRLERFLGASLQREGAETIHGFIGLRTSPGPFVRLVVITVALASVLGLGGTMMAEVDYATTFFMSSTRTLVSNNATRLGIEGAIITFTLLYVLWGGYKSVIFTDRFQVPIAYIGFCVFAVGVAVIATSLGLGFSAALLLALIAVAVLAIVIVRTRLFRRVSATPWERLTIYLTFIPVLAFLTIGVIHSATHGSGSLQPFLALLYKPGAALGFGAWGTIALIFANLIWQFADISSLQRLQSLELTTNDQRRADVARALLATGVEAGLGWFVIVLVGGIMQLAGLTLDGFLPQIAGRADWLAILVPIFIFTAAIYMLSTISGFVSAISYISFYDLLPRSYTRLTSGASTMTERLRAARIVTLIAVVVVFLLYGVIRTAAEGNIAAILYGIYAFQIAILPSVLIALFMKDHLNALPAVISVVCGLIVAYASATSGQPWQIATSLGVDETSWPSMPPLLSGFAAALGYIVTLPLGLLLVGRPRS